MLSAIPTRIVFAWMLILATPSCWGSACWGSDRAVASPIPSIGHELEPIVQRYGEILSTIPSDTKAIEIFVAHIGPALGLHFTLSDLAGPSTAGTTFDKTSAQSPAQTVIQLVADLAAWHLATALGQVAGSAPIASPASLSELLRHSKEQLPWLLRGETRQSLHQAVDLGTLFSSFQRPQSTGTGASPAYTKYASYLDRTYSDLTEADSSWLALAERSGVEGVRQRLRDLEGLPSEQISEGEQASFVARYFDTRLRPVFTAQMVALTIKAQAVAEQGAYKAWATLAQWRDHLKQLQGQARLCGTWQWTVHNHQNHQDHKMLLTFAPPDAQNFGGPRPSKTVFLGDLVFLRWEFSQGYQEDSLLFSSKGQRLEGTFVNSAGPWGSITGKRLTSCTTQSHSAVQNDRPSAK